MKTVETKTVVSSPNHHGNYDNNLHCLITLSSPINSTLRLEFSEFILADANDLVIIRDGGSVLSDNIAVLSAGSQLVGKDRFIPRWCRHPDFVASRLKNLFRSRCTLVFAIRLCSPTGVYYLTSSNVTQIQFITDQLLTARGFQLVVTPEGEALFFVVYGDVSL